MALRQLILGTKLTALREKLAGLVTAAAGLADRRAALNKRDEELAAAVAEVTADTPAEDKATLDAQTEQYAADDDALAAEETENATQRADLERQIADLQSELDTLNTRAKEKPAPAENPTTTPAVGEERKDEHTMKNRAVTFFGMSTRERDEFLAREDVSSFLARVVALAGEKRAVSGGELSVPDIMLGVIRQVISDYSRLLGKVNLVSVGGKARENIVGAIPEAVWMEMVANFNELAFALYDVEVDGFAVGGFIPIPNSLMSDSRYPALASEIMTMLAASIGLALDKAIIYGTGVKMPIGIVTRLAQSAQPSGYPATARAWADLHTSNVLTVRGGTSGAYTTLTGKDLFKGIASAFTAAKSRYSKGDKCWVMSNATYNSLVVAACEINAAGAYVSVVNKQMPIIGGEIITIEDVIPDGEIIGGYFDNYLLAEREGMSLKQSEHVRFLQRQTVFAGEARYDGVPVIAEAFVAIAIDAGDVTTSVTFATDTANPDSANLSALTVGALTLVPSFSESVVTYSASAAHSVSTVKLNSTAKNADKGATVEQKNGSTAVNQGANATLVDGANTLTFKVTYGTTERTYTVTVDRAAS